MPAGRITDFVEKPANPPAVIGKPDVSLCSMGIYIFNAKYLYAELLRDIADPTSSHDFGKDIIPRAVKNGCAMSHSFDRSCVHAPEEKPGMEDYWRDAGTVDAYWEANIDLTATLPALNLYDRNWADLDLPGAAAAGQVRAQPDRSPRHRHRVHGFWRLHHFGEK